MKTKASNRGSPSRHKANSRHTKANLRHFRRQTVSKQVRSGKIAPGRRRPALGSLVQSLPLPGYQPSQFVLPYIGQVGKVVGFRKNYNSVKVQFADGFTLGHNPNNLKKAG